MFLVLGKGMVFFLFKSAAVLHLLLGEESGTSSRGRFSLITTPLAGGVATLDFFASWASYFISIFFNIAAKEKKNQSMNEINILGKERR